MTDEEVLSKAQTYFRYRYNEEQLNKTEFVKDMKAAFNIDEGHWDSEDIKERKDNRRPILTSNKLGKFVAQIVSLERSTPNVDEVIPVDDKGDRVIAKLMNEIITDIEYQSNAEEIYTMSGEHAVAGGFGYWRVFSQMTEDDWDQEIKIEAIKNPCLVSIDPRGKYAFIREVLPVEDFKEQYPNADPIDFQNDIGFDGWELWYEDNKVWVAEFFLKEPTTKTIVEVMNPETGETEVIERTKENEKSIKKMSVIRERDIKTHKIMWYKITGKEVLERKEWPGKYIPIIEVVGHEINLEGRTYKMSLIRDAKDMNKMYNYWLTSMTEKVALSPKSPFMVTPQQIKGFEKMWQEANRKSPMYLLYNGQNTPQRVPPPPLDNAAAEMLQLADSDIKDILGRYESSSGEKSNERSGKAITARVAQSDQNTFAFPDNFRRAKVYTKKILVDLIPKIYDNERIVRLIGTDQTIKINYNAIDENGHEVKINDLSRGRYDVRVKSNISPSRRQQTVENILQAMQYAPTIAPALAPLLFKYMDTPGSEEIAAAAAQAAQQQLQAQQQENAPQAQ